MAIKGQQQQSRGQPKSFLVVDHQQAGPSRPLTFTLMPMKHFKHLSIDSATDKETQHNISGLSSFLGNIPSVLSYQQIDTLQPFSPADTQPLAASPPTITVSQQEHQQQPPRQTAAALEPLPLPPISPFQDHCCKLFQGPFQDRPNLPKTINSCCFKKSQTRSITPPCTKHFGLEHKKVE